MNIIYRILLIVLLFPITFISAAQSGNGYKTVQAGPEYKKSHSYQKKWGSGYRKEWVTPVTVKVLMLDTAFGGLKPDKEGGGNQSHTLHLLSPTGKMYAMRSVDKSVTKVVPKAFQGSFIESHLADQISETNPYAALGVPIMAQAAGVYHALPVYYWVPKQPALGEYNSKYGDHLYLLEQKTDVDWSDADNLGNFKKFVSSEKLLDKLYESNKNRVDQKAFVRARIFDFFIGDWDRHADQWKWGIKEDGDIKVYEPVPNDRDQAFLKINGWITKGAIKATGMDYLKSFENTIPHIAGFSYERRNLDRFFTNEVTLSEWQAIAEDIKKAETDDVIERSIMQLPPEVFAISGKEIIAKLKVRRNDLVKYATQYYHEMAKEVDIVGSADNEYFDISRLDDKHTQVKVYRANKQGEKRDEPYYTRVFNNKETKEVRVFGIDGTDVYNIDGNVNEGINIRIIGGDGKNSYYDNANRTGNEGLFIYDKKKNVALLTGSPTVHYIKAKDTIFHLFNYDTFKPDKKGLHPEIFYNNDDRLYVGLGYSSLVHKWRKLPYGSKQNFDVHYSISQKAFSVNYNGIFTLKSNRTYFLLNGMYDEVKWTNFYGLGNETVMATKDVNYYRLRTEEWLANTGLRFTPGKHQRIEVMAFYANTRPIHDTASFLYKTYAATDPNTYNKTSYAGGTLLYSFTHVNDSIVPTRGLAFTANALYANNFGVDQQFGRYSGELMLFVPLGNVLSFATKTGAATTSGTPLFYQYPWIGGAPALRGYKRERFYGKSDFYNQNDLRLIFNVKGHTYRGKLGVFGFYDDGRVWMPGEASTTWHTAYGGGVIIAPFDKISLKAGYGISPELKVFQLEVNKLF